MCLGRMRSGIEDHGAVRREIAQERSVFLQKDLPQSSLRGWIGVTQMRHPREKGQQEKCTGRRKEHWLAYRGEPSCHWGAGSMPAALAFCAHRDVNQSFILFPHPTPNLIPGAAKSEACSVPKGQNVPLLSCFCHQYCSGRPVALLCYINYPFSTASQWPEAFGNLSFTDGLSLFLLVVGVSIVSAPWFHFNGLFKEGDGNYIWIVFHF